MPQRCSAVAPSPFPSISTAKGDMLSLPGNCSEEVQGTWARAPGGVTRNTASQSQPLSMPVLTSHPGTWPGVERAGPCPIAFGPGAKVGCNPYLCLASRSCWPAHSRYSLQRSSDAAAHLQQRGRRHSVRKWHKDAGVQHSTWLPPTTSDCPIRLGPGTELLLEWDK